MQNVNTQRLRVKMLRKGGLIHVLESIRRFGFSRRNFKAIKSDRQTLVILLRFHWSLEGL